MVTGAEVALLSSLKPVIEKAAGTALGKALMSPVSTAQARMRNKATRKRLHLDPGVSVNIVETTPDFSRELQYYLDSPEFTSLAMSVAVHEFTQTSKRQQIKELDDAKSNLHVSIAALSGSDSANIDAIVNEIWHSLTASIIERVEQIYASNSLPPESRAAVVRMAANYARADIQRSTFMHSVGRLAKYLDFESSFKEQVKSVHATMKLPHAGTTKRVAYSRLFVEPRFVRREESSKQHHSRDPGVDLNEVISSSHRVVILGDPGGGKSTLSLKLAFDIARNGFPGSSAVTPFLVVLRDYTREFEAGKATMLQYLEDLCKSPYNVEPESGFVEYALSSGRAFIIFDGLDELIDTALRRRVVELVESFAYKYPMTPILVTTRKVGYEEAPLDEALFTPVQLAQLNEADVQSYADKWFSLDSTIEKNRREELSRSFYTDSRFVADLTRNPLMLSLMCGIYASENYIPANRPDVYKKCAELLFDKWDKQRGIVTPLPFDAHVKHAINSLAYSIYSNPEKQSGLTRDQLIRFVTGFLLEKRFEDEDEAEAAASQFVDFCTGRAWVLSNVGSDAAQELYGFTHRTFLEYFAANQLVRLNPTAAQLFTKLRRRIARAEWDVVSQLSLQIVGNNTEDGIDDFLERILQAAESATLDEEVNLLSFAARSLAFAVPRPQLLRQICRANVELALKAGSVTRHASGRTSERTSSLFYLRGIGALLHANWENLPTVARNIRYELTPANFQDDPCEANLEIRLALSLCISLIPHTTLDDTFYMDRKVSEFWDKFEAESFSLLESEIVSFSSTRQWVAVAAAMAGIIPMAQVVEKYGPAALFQYHMGPLILRAPFILRLPTDRVDGVCFRCDSAVQRNLEELSEILPACSTPWFTERYDYIPIGGLRSFDGVLSKAFSRTPVRQKDALALMGAAWCELSGEDQKWPTVEGAGDKRIIQLVLKWNAARLNPIYRGSALRSIRACHLKPETIDLLAGWVEGKVQFSSIPSMRESKRRVDVTALPEN
ncbi:NACHT domain-containing protein [Streptomyces sp. NPDC058308]|uniref:NACHT domain-containing protein n=1 Tax=Streptomyces sp. NPDC058308 TaxID=3346440 RepID=UPI0036E2F089